MFSKEVIKQLNELGPCDIVAGLSSLKSEKTIEHVIITIDKGFEQYFPNKKCVIVIGESTGEGTKTQKAIERAAKKTKCKVLPIFSERIGKGEAIRDLMIASNVLNAKT